MVNIKFKLIKTALLTGGILLFINTVIMAVVANFNISIIIGIVVSAALILYGVFFNSLYNVKWLTYTVITGFALFICLALFIAVYGSKDNVTYSEDAVIVLGAGIKGELVSDPLARRLDKAVEYHAKNPAAPIVVSGGQGFEETITEALAMERYLISKGIPKDKIIKEEKSTSTNTNFNNSKEILDKYFDRQYKIVFITNDFHIYRAARLAKAAGFSYTHYHAKINRRTVPMTYLRECAAVIAAWVGFTK